MKQNKLIEIIPGSPSPKVRKLFQLCKEFITDLREDDNCAKVSDEFGNTMGRPFYSPRKNKVTHPVIYEFELYRLSKGWPFTSPNQMIRICDAFMKGKALITDPETGTVTERNLANSVYYYFQDGFKNPDALIKLDGKLWDMITDEQ